MPRRPAPYQYKPKPTHRLTKKEAKKYAEIVKSHLEGDGSWAALTVKAVEREANRLLGIKQGGTIDEYRAHNPKRERRMSNALMDRRFDAYGRRAS